MAEGIGLIGDAKLAEQVIEKFADLDRLTQEECTDLGLDEASCKFLIRKLELNEGPEGNIVPTKQEALLQAGFAQDFVRTLAGKDGLKPVRHRVKWLARQIYKPLEKGSHYNKSASSPLLGYKSIQVFEDSLTILGNDYSWYAGSVVPTLSHLLEKNIAVLDVCEVIGKIGEKANNAVPALIKKLRDKDANIREASAKALGKIGKGARLAFVSLLQLMRRDENVYPTALEAALRIAAHSQDLQRMLQPILDRITHDQDTSDRSTYIRNIVYLEVKRFEDADEKTLQILVRGLKEENFIVAYNAADALNDHHAHLEEVAFFFITRGLAAERSDEEKRAVLIRFPAIDAEILKPSDLDKLYAELNSAHFGVQRFAIEALYQINAPKKRYVKTLIEKLSTRVNGSKEIQESSTELDRSLDGAFVLSTTETSLDVFLAAIERLSWMGSDAKDAVPCLLQLVQDPEESIRRASIEALGEIVDEPADVVPVLVQIVDNQDEKVEIRKEALKALGKFGEKAATAVSVIIKNILVGTRSDTKDVELNQAMFFALGQIGPQAVTAIPFLEKMMNDPTSVLRVECAYAIARIDQKRTDVVQILVHALQSQEPGDRSSAAEYLGEIGIPRARVAIVPLIQLLDDHEERYVIESAMEALRKMGPAAALAVPRLIHFLTSKESSLRAAAAWALGEIGPAAKKAVPQLIACLSDKDETVRNNAAWAFGSIGAEAQIAVPHLIRALSDWNDGVKLAALWSLQELDLKKGQGVEPIAKLIGSPNKEVSDEAVKIFKKVKIESRSVLSALIPLLNSNIIFVKINALDAIGLLGKDARLAVPYVIRLLQDENKEVRWNAAELLGEIGTEAETVIPELVRLLDDVEADVRGTAMYAVSQFGDAAVPYIPRMNQSLRSKDLLDRTAAAASLREIGYHPTIDLRTLILLLQDKEKIVREIAASAFAAFGDKTPEAAPYLMAKLNDTSQMVREFSANALGLIGPSAKEAIPSLIALVKSDHDKDVRVEAVRALCRIGIEDSILRREAVFVFTQLDFATEATVKKMIKFLEDSDPKVRLNAIWVLGQIGPQAQEAVSSLTPFLDDQDPEVIKNTVKALGQIGSPSQPIFKKMETLLGSSDATLQREVLTTLGEYGTEAQDFVPQVTRFIQSDDKAVRLEAIRTLGMIGVEDSACLTALVPLLDNKDPQVRAAAVWAMGQNKTLSEKEASSFLQHLHDEDETVSQASVVALGQMGHKAQFAISALIQLLSSEDSAKVQSVVVALGRIGQESTLIAHALVPLAQKESLEVRVAALWALGANRFMDDQVKSVLSLGLKDRHFLVRATTLRALALFGKRAFSFKTEVIAKCLKDSDADVRSQAAKALSNFDSPTPEVLAALVSAVKDPQANVRLSGVVSLGLLLVNNEEIMSALLSALHDASPLIRAKSAEVMGMIIAFNTRPDNLAEIVSQVVLLLKDDNWQVQLSALNVLKDLHAQSSVASLSDSFLQLVTSQKKPVRLAALQVLEVVGVDADYVIPDLVEALEEESNDEEMTLEFLKTIGSVASDVKEKRAIMKKYLKHKDEAIRSLARSIIRGRA